MINIKKVTGNGPLKNACLRFQDFSFHVPNSEACWRLKNYKAQSTLVLQPLEQ